MKSAALTIGHIVQARALKMPRAVRVEEGFEPVLGDYRIVRLRGPLKVQAVLKAFAAAAGDRHPNTPVPEALEPHGVFNHLDRFGGQGEHWLGWLIGVGPLFHASPLCTQPSLPALILPPRRLSIFRRVGGAFDKAGRVTVKHPTKDMPIGTLRNIFRQAGWKWEGR